MKFLLLAFFVTFIAAHVIPRAQNQSIPAPLVIAFEVDIKSDFQKRDEPLLETEEVIAVGVKRGLLFGNGGLVTNVWNLLFGWIAPIRNRPTRPTRPQPTAPPHPEPTNEPTGYPQPTDDHTEQPQPTDDNTEQPQPTSDQPQPTDDNTDQPQPTDDNTDQPQPTSDQPQPTSDQPEPTGSNGHSFQEELEMNLQGIYYMNVKGGSQKAPFKGLIDTGSSDMWVKKSVYNPADSSSGRVTTDQFQISYQGSSGSASGVWAYDTIDLGNVQIDNFQFGSVETEKTDDSLIGVGKKDLQQTSKKYDNLPWALKSQGKIAKAAFSLYLNSAAAKNGNILFGGIDHAKYEGNLVKLPSKGIRMYGQMDSVTVAGQEFDFSQQVAWDCGYTLSVLPANIVDAMLKLYTGVKQQGLNYQVDCNQDANKKISFSFGQGTGSTTTVTASIGDFIWPYKNLCVFGAKKVNASAGFPDLVLGASFLRNAYTVYDLEDNTISVAQVKYSSQSDIKNID
ncbi:hypothetical protein DICA2_E32572 [Diutina catenulata]